MAYVPPVGKGQKVAQYEDILMEMTVSTPTDTGCAAGEVYTVSPFVFIVPVTTTKDSGNNQVVPGWTEGHYVVRKKAGTAWVVGDPITFEAVAGKDYLAADVATAGQAIHAYATVAADAGDVLGQIVGPFLPPYGVVGTMADILAALTGAPAGSIVVADGTGGISVTTYQIPLADGAAGQILATDGALTVSWTTEALTALVAAGNAGQVVVADGAAGAQLTAYALPVVDGAANQVLSTDGALAVTWGDDMMVALLAGANAGQIVVADGANAAALTVYAVPTADGVNTQVLITDGAAAVSWGAN
jgi:hypothetical protein